MKRKKKTSENADNKPFVCMCGKCGEEKEIALLVDGVPWCSDCFCRNTHVVDSRTGKVIA